MSEEQKEQAVIEKTDDQATPGTEGDDARDGDELEALLSEYDAQEADDGTPPADGTGSKPDKSASESEQKPETVHDLEAIKTRLTEWEKREADRQFRKDMNEAIGVVRGDLDGELFDERFMESWIDGQARDDPRLARAWQERHDNPKQFQRVLEGLGQKFAKKFKDLPDRQATEDREAVTAAVRGASTKAPESKAPDYSSMTDAEFREKTEQDFGFSPLI